MVGNMLENALAYSPPGSPVEVRLREDTACSPRQMVLTVCNAPGKAGVPDAQQVFHKYYRTDGAHQRTGSGLGLYLVKSLAEREQGNIAYRTEAAADGSMRVVFELRLPCH